MAKRETKEEEMSRTLTLKKEYYAPDGRKIKGFFTMNGKHIPIYEEEEDQNVVLADSKKHKSSVDGEYREDTWHIKDLDLDTTVIVYKKQKPILDILDDMLENDRENPEWDVFQDDSFFIQYKDGSTFSVDASGTSGRYKKNGIEGIYYSNAGDTQVYGEYEMNEYGVATLKEKRKK